MAPVNWDEELAQQAPVAPQLPEQLPPEGRRRHVEHALFNVQVLPPPDDQPPPPPVEVELVELEVAPPPEVVEAVVQQDELEPDVQEERPEVEDGPLLIRDIADRAENPMRPRVVIDRIRAARIARFEGQFGAGGIFRQVDDLYGDGQDNEEKEDEQPPEPDRPGAELVEFDGFPRIREPEERAVPDALPIAEGLVIGERPIAERVEVVGEPMVAIARIVAHEDWLEAYTLWRGQLINLYPALRSIQMRIAYRRISRWFWRRIDARPLNERVQPAYLVQDGVRVWNPNAGEYIPIRGVMVARGRPFTTDRDGVVRETPYLIQQLRRRMHGRASYHGAVQYMSDVAGFVHHRDTHRASHGARAGWLHIDHAVQMDVNMANRAYRVMRLAEFHTVYNSACRGTMFPRLHEDPPRPISEWLDRYKGLSALRIARFLSRRCHKRYRFENCYRRQDHHAWWIIVLTVSAIMLASYLMYVLMAHVRLSHRRALAVQDGAAPPLWFLWEYLAGLDVLYSVIVVACIGGVFQHYWAFGNLVHLQFLWADARFAVGLLSDTSAWTMLFGRQSYFYGSGYNSITRWVTKVEYVSVLVGKLTPATVSTFTLAYGMTIIEEEFSDRFENMIPSRRAYEQKYVYGAALYLQQYCELQSAYTSAHTSELTINKLPNLNFRRRVSAPWWWPSSPPESGPVTQSI
jgi:hypothetical protein